ncbi:DUF2905 domain-containing protein [Candidatus Giovannonibacteria bacterium]|nr:DUF2905 domain-containing protein [Candidatus Giovannonibacteria bacterium]
MPSLGKVAIFLSVLLVVAGIFTIIFQNSNLGRLPGDMLVTKNNFKFYFPFTTSLVLSGSVSALAALLVILF